jgi:hypothetical protein
MATIRASIDLAVLFTTPTAAVLAKLALTPDDYLIEVGCGDGPLRAPR